MPRCEKCQGELAKDPTPLRSHTEVIGGIHVVLIDSVWAMRCPNDPEVSFTEVPDLEGLRAAVAVRRISAHEKLSGLEIRFLRRAVGWKARELADSLNKAEEVVSRWESGKLAMGESTERLLRLLVGLELAKTTSVSFDPKAVAMLKILPVRDVNEPIHMYLIFRRKEVVRVTEDRQEVGTQWWPEARAVSAMA